MCVCICVCVCVKEGEEEKERERREREGEKFIMNPSPYLVLRLTFCCLKSMLEKIEVLKKGNRGLVQNKREVQMLMLRNQH